MSARSAYGLGGQFSIDKEWTLEVSRDVQTSCQGWDIVDVIYHTSVEIFESKKKALADGDEALATQIGRGKDIMSILSE